MSDTNRNEDTKFKIPEKIRVSIDKTDEIAYQRYQSAETEQDRLRAQFAGVSPADQTPKQRERRNAVVLIETLENVQDSGNLTDDQTEQLAESYALIGEYSRAAATTLDADKCREYERYHEAVFLEDDEVCAHPDKHKYIRDHSVWSVRDEAEYPLVACNVCRIWNVTPFVPSQLIEQQKRRAEVRKETRGMDQQAVSRFLSRR